MPGIEDIVTVAAIRDEAQYVDAATAKVIREASDEQIADAIARTHRGHEDLFFALHDSMQSDAVAFLVDDFATTDDAAAGASERSGDVPGDEDYAAQEDDRDV